MPSNTTILIAEDENVSRRLMEASLMNWGYKVLAAKDGDEACSMLQQNDAALCILDWEMPGKNGVEVCRWIRSNLKTQPYIVMLTAHGQKEEIEQGYRAGANVYMTKPFDRALLKEQVARGLSSRSL